MMKIDDLLGFKRSFNDLSPRPMLDHGLVEFHADEMAESWKFDPVLPDSFLERYFEYREGEYIPRKKPLSEKSAYRRAKQNRRDSRYRSSTDTNS
jgi:hypothetical protein